MTTLRSFGPLRATALAVAVVALSALAGPALAVPSSSYPGLSIQGSPSGYPVGSWIFGSAMVGQGASTAANLVFSVFPPSDPTCAGSPLFTSTVRVTGSGYHQSGYHVAQVAGTYRWIVRYDDGGDKNAAPATSCSDPAGEVIISRRLPHLRSAASLASPTVIQNAGTIVSSGGPGGATGTLTFSLWGAGNMTCAGPPIFTSVKPVSGNATYTSDVYHPTTAGTYQWTVQYSGDANNNPTFTLCSDTSNSVTVSGAVSGTTVTAAPTSLRAYEWLTVSWNNVTTPTSGDWFGFYPVGAADSAALFWKYTNGTSTGSMNVLIPWSTRAGSYEVRLFANNTTQRIDSSDVVTITA